MTIRKVLFEECTLTECSNSFARALLATFCRNCVNSPENNMSNSRKKFFLSMKKSKNKKIIEEDVHEQLETSEDTNDSVSELFLSCINSSNKIVSANV